MTKSGAEKKRVRRAATHNGTRDPNDTPPKKQSTGKDVFQLFADKVRDHKDFESRWAVLQETRIEYFRGKDFVGFLRSHPELKDVLGSDTSFEVEDIANTLLRKNLLVRCDRVVKTVRPGKKKLSTWPAHLEIFPGAVMAESIFGFDQSFGRFVYSSIADSGCTSILVLMDQVFSENDAFFAWTFVKRRPLWQTVLSFLWPVATLAICLFPVFPHQLKLIVLYSCAGILLLIMSLLLVRSVIFGALWIILGKRVWFFPNILAEEATLSELFQFWPTKDEGERPKWTARLTYAIGAVLVILLLRHHAPDEAARARYHKRVSNIIDDVLEWSPRLALSGMMEKQPTVVNETQNNHSGDGSKTAAEEVTVSEDTNVDSSSGGHVSDDSGDEGSDNHI